MNDFTETLIEDYITEDAQVDDSAKAQFLKALKEKYLDLDAFHRAYDALINDFGLDSLFDIKGKLAHRGTYGQIKNCQNPELLFGLKKLWVAQFSDGIMTKDEQAAYNKRQADLEAKRKAREEAERIERERKEQEMQLKADDTLAKIITALPNTDGYDEATDVFHELCGKDLVDAVYLKVNSTVDYWLSFNDFSRGYYVTEVEMNNIERLCKWAVSLVWSYAKVETQNIYNKMFDDFLAKYNLTEQDVSGFTFIGKDGEAYYLAPDRESRYEKKYILHVRKDDGYYHQVEYKELPNPNDLQLVAVSKDIDYTTGRCYVSHSWQTYYNPTFSNTILGRCGISTEEHDGGLGEISTSFVQASDIEDKYKRLGLTRAESNHYELDSSD